MDAVEFFNELKRMCQYYKSKCDNCALFSVYQPYFESRISCDNFIFSIKTYESVKIVEQWSKEHPRKSRVQDFKEKYPNAPLTNGDVPRGCCATMGYRDFCNVVGEYTDCIKCWNEPVE